MDAGPASLAPIPVIADSPPVLAYAPVDPDAKRKRRKQIAWLSSTLPGLVAPFVAFSHFVSPLTAARESFGDGGFVSGPILGCVGLSFFLIYPLTFWRLRQTLTWRMRKFERVAAFAVALIGSIPIAVLLFHAAPGIWTEITRPMREHQLLELGAIAMLLGGVTTGIVTATRIRKPAPDAAIEALFIGPYLSNAAYLLLAFYEDRPIGYWLTAITVAVLATQLFRMPARARRSIHVL